MKKVLILGSTGSIGKNTLEVIRQNRNKFKVVGLATKSNIELLKKQMEDFEVKYGCIVDEKFKTSKFNSKKIFFSTEGLLQIIEETKPDILVNAIVGIDGLKPLLYAIKQKIKNIALANKESLVVAGRLVMDEVKKNEVNLFPIDSEHSAIWQCLKNENIKNVEQVIITASGGPLFKKNVVKKTPDFIVSHPVWKMGKKISVDSATLVNKGFECIEAHYLFDIPYEKIDVVIHPQVLIHSFVKFIDGNILACLFVPDMKIPISYALGCAEERLKTNVKKFDLFLLNKIEFYKPDFKKFPSFKLLMDCVKTNYESYPIVFNAANEVLVEKFLNKEIKFETIHKVLKKIIENHRPKHIATIEEIFVLDKDTRLKVLDELNCVN
jgi:1-deoxy-D-xylulose-5-phosphate reductoisomerase